jgi:hypothetical protein
MECPVKPDVNEPVQFLAALPLEITLTEARFLPNALTQNRLPHSRICPMQNLPDPTTALFAFLVTRVDTIRTHILYFPHHTDGVLIQSGMIDRATIPGVNYN